MKTREQAQVRVHAHDAEIHLHTTVCSTSRATSAASKTARALAPAPFAPKRNPRVLGSYSLSIVPPHASTSNRGGSYTALTANPAVAEQESKGKANKKPPRKEGRKEGKKVWSEHSRHAPRSEWVDGQSAIGHLMGRK